MVIFSNFSCHLFDDVCDSSLTIASREKKQQHRLQKATSTGNAAAVESKQEQEIGTRLVQGNKENLLQEIDLSNSPYTVTGGQHSEVDKSNVNIDKNLVAVEEVNMGTVHTGGVTTTIQVHPF